MSLNRILWLDETSLKFQFMIEKTKYTFLVITVCLNNDNVNNNCINFTCIIG